jgi:hypothetical protein
MQHDRRFTAPRARYLALIYGDRRFVGISNEAKDRCVIAGCNRKTAGMDRYRARLRLSAHGSNIETHRETGRRCRRGCRTARTKSNRANIRKAQNRKRINPGNEGIPGVDDARVENVTRHTAGRSHDHSS